MLSDRFQEFRSYEEYKLNAANLIPPYVVTYPSPNDPTKTAIVFGNVNAEDEQEVIKTDQLVRYIQALEEQLLKTDLTNIDESGKSQLIDIVKQGEVGRLIDRILSTIGPYSERPDVTLTPSEYNVAISRSGTKVAKQGWCIASFLAEKGNEYKFAPGTMDGDVCLFSEEIIKQEVRSINYTYQYNDEGYVTKASATYNGQTHTYAFAYEKDEDGRVVSETITDEQTNQTVNALPYQYQTTVGTYQPLTVLNANAELPIDGYCRFISHFQGNGQIKVVVSFHLASANRKMQVSRDGYTANLATQLGNLLQRIDEIIRILGGFDEKICSHDTEIGNIITRTTCNILPTLCGQPAILFGEGTPQEAVVPHNWKQFDPETGEGYNWNGRPSAEGQQYINTSATSGGRYIAIRASYDPNSASYYTLKWVNC